MPEKTPKLQVIALFDYESDNHEDIPTTRTTEASRKSLTVCKGQRFEVLNDEVDWWLLVRSHVTQEEGFIPSTCVAPLRRDLTDEQLLALDEGKHLCLSMINSDVDMKYFPDVPHEKSVLERRTCPEQETNIFSRLTFWWLTGLIITGYKRPLQDSDLWELSANNKSSTIVPRLQQEWNKELKAQKLKEHRTKNGPREEVSETSQLKQDEVRESYISGKKEYQPSLVKALIRVYGPYFAIAVVFELINGSLLFVQPYLLRLLIQYTEDKGNSDTWKGYVYMLCMVVVAIVQLVAVQQYFHIACSTGMRIRSGVLGIVYAKAIKLSSSARRKTTAGEMVNLMSIDAKKLMELMTNLNLMWSAPLQILVAICFLYNVMDVAILAGVAVLLLVISLNLVVTKLCRRLQVEQMRHKDERTKMINEVLSGIKVLKLYAWEESFMKKIAAVREEELKYLTRSSYLHWGFAFIFRCTPFLVSMATFAVYVMSGNELTAAKAFVSVALFNVLRYPIRMMHRVYMDFIEAQVSVKRLSDFLSLDEMDHGAVIHFMPEHFRTQSVHVNEGTFNWDEKSESVLRNINLKIERGSLLGIVGPVGCGKSTLLSALLGETHKVSGEVYVEGTTAYVSQLAWIQNATLRDNVLFGNGFDYKKYHQILNSCALKPDIAVLPTRDLTEIGEKGVNLSGGQKQRVSLARAVYFDADVYLLDDPLSAVDSNVGRHIFNKVIGSEGLLKEKTRILVTHQTQFLPQMDHIIYLQDGRISEEGTYTELMANEGLFAEYVKTHQADENNQSSTEQSEVKLVDDKPKTNLGEKVTNKAGGNLITKETSQTGKVKFSVFMAYARSLGILCFILILLFAISAEGFLISSRIWLADWSTTNITSTSQRDLYLGIYGVFGICQAGGTLLYQVVMAYAGMKAARKLHQKLLVNIMHSPMTFFETTPLGQIVNRFSNDMNAIDDTIPKTIIPFLRNWCTVVGTIVVISYSTPLFLTCILPLGVLYICFQRVYVATSRQLKRITFVNHSPVNNHFLETINGTSTVRAYSRQDWFIQENYRRIDQIMMASYPFHTVNRWLAVRLEFIASIILLFAALFSVINRQSVSSGLIGLSITYALQVTGSLNWVVRHTSDLETNIVSVERVKEYCETPQEADWIIETNRPPNDWPQEGKIQVDELNIRYREELPMALEDVTFDVKASEKIGIVGRTGAGKTSLPVALFRILESARGKIVIDGIDISTIGLQDLRSRLAIIPQDPVLFSGSLRMNLDPFNIHLDDKLWRVLEVSQLKSFVSELPDGLSHHISEGGENLSMGQRQLMCLARALLRESKILVLDEATAAVDLETDEFIQKTIRQEFADKTVLTIAHRLNTVIDCSRILVLDNGRVAEFDTPANLQARRGIFHSMACSMGLSKLSS